MSIHSTERSKEHAQHKLSKDEALILKGALELSAKTVAAVQTPIDHVFMISEDDKMDAAMMDAIIERGHSRVPVYRGSRNHVVGAILVKNLIRLRPEDETPIRDLKIRQVPTVPTTKKCYDLLNLFQMGKSHLAIVVSNEDHITITGIVTLEDLVEELLLEEIIDESDRYSDMATLEPVAHRSTTITLTDSGGVRDSVESLRSAVNAAVPTRPKSTRKLPSGERRPLLLNDDDDESIGRNENV